MSNPEKSENSVDCGRQQTRRLNIDDFSATNLLDWEPIRQRSATLFIGKMADNQALIHRKMCQKVSELTRIIHVLFRKHHEKDAELALTKDAYETEIDNIIKEAKSQISKFQDELDNVRLSQNDFHKQQLQKELTEMETNYCAQLSECQKALRLEAEEVKRLRQALSDNQDDMDQLKRNSAAKISRLNDELNDYKKDLQRYKAATDDQEDCLKRLENCHRLADDFKKRCENAEKELTITKMNLEQSEKSKEGIVETNKKQSLKIKTLKTELESLRQKVKKESSLDPETVEEEIAILKREIERYRMELRNRELNYNRMFALQQPVVVERRESKIGTMLAPRGNKRSVDLKSRMSKERSYYSDSSGSGERKLEQLVSHMRRPTLSGDGSFGPYLPHLPTDGGTPVSTRAFGGSRPSTEDGTTHPT